MMEWYCFKSWSPLKDFPSEQLKELRTELFLTKKWAENFIGNLIPLRCPGKACKSKHLKPVVACRVGMLYQLFIQLQTISLKYELPLRSDKQLHSILLDWYELMLQRFGHIFRCCAITGQSLHVCTSLKVILH